DVRASGDEVQRQQAEDGAIARGPFDAKALERPESAEGCEQNSADELQKAARDPGPNSLQDQPDCSDHDNGSDAADDRHTQLIGVGAERDDDERNLETFENDRLEGEDEGRPVEPGTGPLEWLVSGGKAEAGQAVRRDSNHALPEPL